MQLRSTAKSLELADLSYLVIQAEVESKWRAIIVALERIPLEPARNLALNVLYQLRFDGTVSSWIDSAARIGSTAAKLTAKKSDVASLIQLKALCEEFSVYFYFCATLQGFFVNTLTAKTFDAVSKAGNIERLAKAKQAFALNSAIAKSVINEVRQQLGMNVPTFFHLSIKPGRRSIKPRKITKKGNRTQKA